MAKVGKDTAALDEWAVKARSLMMTRDALKTSTVLGKVYYGLKLPHYPVGMWAPLTKEGWHELWEMLE